MGAVIDVIRRASWSTLLPALVTMRVRYFLAFATSAAVTAGAVLPQALRI